MPGIDKAWSIIDSISASTSQTLRVEVLHWKINLNPILIFIELFLKKSKTKTFFKFFDLRFNKILSSSLIKSSFDNWNDTSLVEEGNSDISLYCMNGDSGTFFFFLYWAIELGISFILICKK